MRRMRGGHHARGRLVLLHNDQVVQVCSFVFPAVLSYSASNVSAAPRVASSLCEWARLTSAETEAMGGCPSTMFRIGCCALVVEAML